MSTDDRSSYAFLGVAAPLLLLWMIKLILTTPVVMAPERPAPFFPLAPSTFLTAY